MSKSKNISYLLAREIDKAYASGKQHSKRADRQKGTATGKVYARQTAKNYAQSCRQYAAWVRDNHPDAYRSMDAAKAYVPEWLATHANSGTRMAHAAALAKAYHQDGGKSWGVDLGRRPLGGIQRGRQETARQASWRANHADAAEALRCCGLRRAEAQALRGRDIIQRGGQWYAHVASGKGGLERCATIYHTADNHAGLDWLRSQAACAGADGRIFGGVPDMAHANIHALRAAYAVRMYHQYEGDGHTATGSMYTPRDGSATSWDKGCLRAVNHDLGHGDNRASTAYYNYLSYGNG